MVNKLILKNFKAFKYLELDLSYINILSGVNGGGKSTVIQSLLLLVQSKVASKSNSIDKINLNGYFLKYFNKNELLCVNANDSEFTIELDGIEFKTNGESIDSEIFLEKEKDFTIYDHFDYISADRFGPKRYHEEIVLPYNMIGKYGENTINMLTKYYDKIYNNLEKSLSFIFNEKINIQPVNSNDMHVSSIGLKNYKSVFADFFNPIHMPFGLSYLLPILVSIEITKYLHNDKKSLLIFENPEAHLHPSAQSRLGYIFAKESYANLQLIIETHSEHIINGMLIGLKDKKIKREDININFFTKSNEIGENKNTPITLDKDDKIDIWPEGFMDQFTNDSYRILNVSASIEELIK